MGAKSFSFSTLKTLKNIAAYFLLFLAGDLLSSIIFDLIFLFVKFQNYNFYAVPRMLGCTALTFLLFWLYTNKVLHLKMKDFKITMDIKCWGVVLSILLPVFVATVFLLIGTAEVNTSAPGKIILTIIVSIVTALKAGVLEEMLFRGFIMTLLENRWNKYIAILLPSVLFSLLHIPSMEYFSIGGVLLLVGSGTLVGIMFSLIAYRGKSISNGALIHAVWNFMFVTSLLHITTVEGAYGKPLFSIIIPSDHVWLTGGGFGMEASLVAVIGYLFVCIAAAFVKKPGNKQRGITKH